MAPLVPIVEFAPFRERLDSLFTDPAELEGAEVLHALWDGYADVCAGLIRRLSAYMLADLPFVAPLFTPGHWQPVDFRTADDPPAPPQAARLGTLQGGVTVGPEYVEGPDFTLTDGKVVFGTPPHRTATATVPLAGQAREVLTVPVTGDGPLTEVTIAVTFPAGAIPNLVLGGGATDWRLILESPAGARTVLWDLGRNQRPDRTAAFAGEAPTGTWRLYSEVPAGTPGDLAGTTIALGWYRQLRLWAPTPDLDEDLLYRNLGVLTGLSRRPASAAYRLAIQAAWTALLSGKSPVVLTRAAAAIAGLPVAPANGRIQQVVPPAPGAPAVVTLARARDGGLETIIFPDDTLQPVVVAGDAVERFAVLGDQLVFRDATSSERDLGSETAFLAGAEFDDFLARFRVDPLVPLSTVRALVAGAIFGLEFGPAATAVLLSDPTRLTDLLAVLSLVRHPETTFYVRLDLGGGRFKVLDVQGVAGLPVVLDVTSRFATPFDYTWRLLVEDLFAVEQASVPGATAADKRTTYLSDPVSYPAFRLGDDSIGLGAGTPATASDPGSFDVGAVPVWRGEGRVDVTSRLADARAFRVGAEPLTFMVAGETLTLRPARPAPDGRPGWAGVVAGSFILTRISDEAVFVADTDFTLDANAGTVTHLPAGAIGVGEALTARYAYTDARHQAPATVLNRILDATEPDTVRTDHGFPAAVAAATDAWHADPAAAPHLDLGDDVVGLRDRIKVLHSTGKVLIR